MGGDCSVRGIPEWLLRLNIEIRGIDESEYEGWFIDHDVAFGRRATAEDAARARPSVEVDRALAAFEGAAIVGTTHALPTRSRWS